MFKLRRDTVNILKSMKPNFGYNGFGELIYYRTYSRIKEDGRQEQWSDTVIRVIEGIMSIREEHYATRNLPWNKITALDYAHNMALSLFKMEWLPPGRGLWCMGTDLIRKRGAMPLYNCAYTDIGTDLVNDLCWIMDLLMHGVGVGFGPIRDDNLRLHLFKSDATVEYVIEDTREGWVDSVRTLLERYTINGPEPLFNYNFIRSAGQPLLTFGGTASGPGPLKELHGRIRATCERFLYNEIDSVEFKTDLANQIGCCVVAGNIRRSAEIAVGQIDDTVFMDLKNYKLNPQRSEWGWMSNNSVRLRSSDDFNMLGQIAQRVVKNGEPGFLNMKNLKYGRIGDSDYKPDSATGINPCGEVPLQNKEVCNLSCTVPTRCATEIDWYKACEYATFYSSTVALFPTHQPETNAVIARNRRIGVDIIGYANWRDQHNTHEIISYLRNGYKCIKNYNRMLADEAGVPPSIRVTTMKPGGTVSKLVGRAPGAHHPNYTYMLRRVRIQRGTVLNGLMRDANIPFEPCVNQPEYTDVFEYPIYNGGARPVGDVSLWEQANNLVLLQKHWSDNAVSNTLYFTKDEEDDVENVLSSIASVTKSVSMMPLFDAEDSPYPQMPEQKITKEEYMERVRNIKQIDWTTFRGDGIDEKYCTSESCLI